MLLDRERERRLLEQVLKDLQVGKSRALVLRGEAGVGKTAILEQLIAQASACQVVQAAGIESEQELAFAGLHQVCTTMLDRLAILPGPQQAALRTVFGLSVGNPPDQFLVGLAVLSLFAEVARVRPLLCVVDDAQWLDHASALVLAFVARRLRAESVAMIFGVRDSTTGLESQAPELTGLDELRVGGLPEHQARALVVSARHGPVDESILDRILAESRGNPLALLELPRGFASTELAGGFGLRRSGRLPRWIEESFRRQIAPLPTDTQTLLLIAAAEPMGDPALLWRAADRTGIGVERDAAPAVAAGLLDLTPRIRFRHPLVRSAIYRAALPEQRRQAHRALAEATDPAKDPDRRAWHRAQAADGPDEEIAAELERCADRAQRRGGMTAAAAFLQQAAGLTPDPQRRARRALSAARVKLEAGSPSESLRLLTQAEAGPLDELQHAEVDLFRARIAFMTNRGSDGPSLLLKAATQLQQLDVRLARDTYLEALDAARFAAHLATGAGVHEVAEAARTVAPLTGPPRASDLLLDGLAVRYTEGYAAALPRLRQAVAAFRGPDLPTDEGLRWLWLASTTCPDQLWDDEGWEVLANRHLQLVRDTGAFAMLPLALTSSIVMHISLGELAVAEALLEEQKAVVQATEMPLAWYGPLFLAAWQGRAAEAFELIETGLEENARRGEGDGVIACGWGKALLCNSLGRSEEALSAAREATAAHLEIGTPYWSSLVELITAAVRVKHPELAADAFERLSRATSANGSNWALGLEYRCRALLSTDNAAENFYREAIARLAKTRIRGELARTHLYYGEWLRRENRGVDAREQLRCAHQLFTAMGAEIFVERAAGELAAAGETVHRRSVEGPGDLTAQEGHIARLASEGLSNVEIAARLFISPRTVEWHLSKVFAKLGVTSRRQLRR